MWTLKIPLSSLAENAGMVAGMGFVNRQWVSVLTQPAFIPPYMPVHEKGGSVATGAPRDMPSANADGEASIIPNRTAPQRSAVIHRDCDMGASLHLNAW